MVLPANIVIKKKRRIKQTLPLAGYPEHWKEGRGRTIRQGAWVDLPVMVLILHFILESPVIFLLQVHHHRQHLGHWNRWTPVTIQSSRSTIIANTWGTETGEHQSQYNPPDPPSSPTPGALKQVNTSHNTILQIHHHGQHLGHWNRWTPVTIQSSRSTIIANTWGTETGEHQSQYNPPDPPSSPTPGALKQVNTSHNTILQIHHHRQHLGHWNRWTPVTIQSSRSTIIANTWGTETGEHQSQYNPPDPPSSPTPGALKQVNTSHNTILQIHHHRQHLGHWNRWTPVTIQSSRSTTMANTWDTETGHNTILQIHHHGQHLGHWNRSQHNPPDPPPWPTPGTLKQVNTTWYNLKDPILWPTPEHLGHWNRWTSQVTMQSVRSTIKTNTWTPGAMKQENITS